MIEDADQGIVEVSQCGVVHAYNIGTTRVTAQAIMHDGTVFNCKVCVLYKAYNSFAGAEVLTMFPNVCSFYSITSSIKFNFLIRKCSFLKYATQNYFAKVLLHKVLKG